MVGLDLVTVLDE